MLDESANDRPLRFRAPVKLEGRYIALVPLARAHAAPLAREGADPQIWEFMRSGPLTDVQAMRRFIDTLLERQLRGTDLPFTTGRLPGGSPIGMTRFLEIDRENRLVEVGGTWLAPRFWSSPINTESKLLMLSYAFETEGVNRVEIRTDVRNVRSQRAIERLGAKKEGVLRDNIVLSNGRIRSSVLYSVVRSEWPAVHERLEKFLERPWSQDLSVRE
jgi:N-acetyltransferase